jgi:hypothetical protein
MFFGFRLSLRRLGDGRLVFSVPPVLRYTLLAIGVIVLAALLLTSPSGLRGVFVWANTIPLALVVLALLGAAYEERWTFDRNADRLLYQYGLIFARGRREHRISELERVETSQFIRGTMGSRQAPRRSLAFRPVLTLSLQTKDGRLLRLETYAASQRPKMETAARAIAEYCGLPIESNLSGSES